MLGTTHVPKAYNPNIGFVRFWHPKARQLIVLPQQGGSPAALNMALNRAAVTGNSSMSAVSGASKESRHATFVMQKQQINS